MKGPLRVVHLISTPAGMGGAEKVVLALTQAAEEKGWCASVLNPFDAEPGASRMSTAFPQQAYVAASHHRADLLRARRWCAVKVAELEPRLLHVQMAHAGLIGATLRIEIPRLLSHQHGDYFEAHHMRLRAAADRWATRRFDRIVAVSNYVCRFLRDRYRLDPRRLSTIPNGWEGKPLPRAPSGRPTVIAVGNIRKGKGHATLIEAFARVAVRISGAQLVILGDGPLRPLIERRAAEVAPSGSVRFEGSVEDVWPYLAEAHVMALPSFTETAGIAAMEAMAAGLPVVASDVGGLPELVKLERTGLLVPPRDSRALAAALIRVLSHPEIAKAWGEAGRGVAQGFSSGRMVDAYYGLYDGLTRRMEGKRR